MEKVRITKKILRIFEEQGIIVIDDEDPEDD